LKNHFSPATFKLTGDVACMINDKCIQMLVWPLERLGLGVRTLTPIVNVYGVMVWLEPALDNVQGYALVNTVMNRKDP
jgi:hypothetical protein